jgi:hypothetical protein
MTKESRGRDAAPAGDPVDVVSLAGTAALSYDLAAAILVP